MRNTRRTSESCSSIHEFMTNARSLQASSSTSSSRCTRSCNRGADWESAWLHVNGGLPDPEAPPQEDATTRAYSEMQIAYPFSRVAYQTLHHDSSDRSVAVRCGGSARSKHWCHERAQRSARLCCQDRACSLPAVAPGQSQQRTIEPARPLKGTRGPRTAQGSRVRVPVDIRAGWQTVGLSASGQECRLGRSTRAKRDNLVSLKEQQ